MILKSISRLFCFFILFSLVWSISFAQHLHSPSDIMRIMEESSTNYVIDSLEEAVSLISLERHPNSINKLLSYSASNNQTNKKHFKYQKKAEKLHKKGKYERSISFYRKTYTDTLNISAVKNIGDCYIALGNLPQAIQMYRRLLDKAPNDPFLMATIASLYHQNNELDKACTYITNAHLLNRNDTKLLATLKDIYSSNELYYQDWTLIPQYKLQKTDKGAVHIAFQHTPWLAYGSCKAVWTYEDKHKEKMKNVSNAAPAIVEEKECLLNALITYEMLEEDKNNYPDLKMLSIALPKRKIDEYIFYEIQLPQNPNLIDHLSKEEMNNLAQYVLGIRSEKAK